jgi:hypothetical protein
VNIVTVKPQDSTTVFSLQWRRLLMEARTVRRLVAPKIKEVVLVVVMVCSLQFVAVY